MIEAAKLNDAVAEANPVGTVYMPYSGLLIARQNNWLVSIKGFSQYIWDFEGSTSENLYGRYLSYDHVEYSDLVNHYRSFDLSLEARNESLNGIGVRFQVQQQKYCRLVH